VTDRPRRAYAIEFETTPSLRDVPLDKPWIEAARAVLGHPESRRFMADGELREL
jgi:hypothetical protein